VRPAVEGARGPLYSQTVQRQVSPLAAVLGLVVFAAATAALFLAFFSVFDGRDWQALAFGAGGLSLACWAGLRLTARRA